MFLYWVPQSSEVYYLTVILQVTIAIHGEIRISAKISIMIILLMIQISQVLQHSRSITMPTGLVINVAIKHVFSPERTIFINKIT